MKRILTLFVLLGSATVILVNCGAGKMSGLPESIPQQRCELPVWNKGDYWKYQLFDRRWWSEAVVEVENDIYVVESGRERQAIDKKTLRFKRWVDSQGRRVPSRSEEGPIFYDFPLYVGKKWGKMVQGQLFDGAGFDYLYSFRVLSFEEVTVAAGTFKAFKIEMEQRVMQQNATANAHIWFSPEAKNLVKTKFIGSYGSAWNIKGQDIELVEYKLSP